MAKSAFWLRGASGKLAGTVLYQSQGSTIQREIVTPKNPQSDNQMRQRAAFAGASKFYQNAQQNRFVLAFQNKKGNQSEFNAFMQKNLREFDTLTYPTRDMANTPEFCNFFPWICTEGNLQAIPVMFPDNELTMLGCKIQVLKSDDSYVQDWDELIALNTALNLQYGDIITLTVVLNDEVFSDASLDVVIGNIAPRWITRQFVIGADLGGYNLEQYINLNGLAFGITDFDEVVGIGINLDDICKELGINNGTFSTTDVAAMICVTRSRNEGSKLKVSPSRFYLDDMAQRIFERLSNDSAMREAIESYKKSSNSKNEPSNILQGSVAEVIPVSDIYYRNNSGDEVHVFAPATDISAEAITSSGNSVAKIDVYGMERGEKLLPSNIEATATGYTISTVAKIRYSHTQGSHSMTRHEGVEITLTKTGTNASSTPFVIKYKGVQVASGNIVVTA